MRTAARLLGAFGLALGVSLAAPVVPASVPGLGPAPAAAEACGGTDGVTVVVDFNGLGGGVSQACVAGGGGVARSLFSRAGVAMRDVQGQPGFICQVQAKPSAQACVRGPSRSEYWSLWWSSGNGRWVYSDEGVNLLDVPSGGFVAWSWKRSVPTASAARPRPEKPVEPLRTGGGTGGSRGSGPTGGQGAGGGSSEGPSSSPESDPGASDAPSEDPSADGGAATERKKTERDGKGGRRGGKAAGRERGTDERGADRRRGGDRDTPEDDGTSVDSPLTDENGDTEQVSSASEEDPAGLPAWVPLAALVVLALGGVGAVVARRRRSSG